MRQATPHSANPTPTPAQPARSRPNPPGRALHPVALSSSPSSSSQNPPPSRSCVSAALIMPYPPSNRSRRAVPPSHHRLRSSAHRIFAPSPALQWRFSSTKRIPGFPHSSGRKLPISCTHATNCTLKKRTTSRTCAAPRRRPPPFPAALASEVRGGRPAVSTRRALVNTLINFGQVQFLKNKAHSPF